MSSAALPAPDRFTGRWRRRSAPAGCQRDRRAVRSPRSCASRSVSARPGGVAGIGDGGHGGQIGAGPHDLVAAGTRLPVGGADLVAGSAGGHGHGQVDVVVLAEEDPLEPVLLDPGQMPDEAEQAGPDGTPGVRCCSAVSPADTRTTASRTLARKYNSTSRSESATSRPALSLTLSRLRLGPTRVAGHPLTQATGRAAQRLPARVP